MLPNKCNNALCIQVEDISLVGVGVGIVVVALAPKHGCRWHVSKCPYSSRFVDVMSCDFLMLAEPRGNIRL